MLVSIASPDKTMFYIDWYAGQSPIPTFAFKFSEDILGLREVMLMNQKITLATSRRQRNRFLIYGNMNYLSRDSFENFQRQTDLSLVDYTKQNGKRLIELTCEISDEKYQLFQRNLEDAIHWSIIIVTPQKTFRVYVRFSNNELETIRELAPNELPKFG